MPHGGIYACNFLCGKELESWATENEVETNTYGMHEVVGHCNEETI